MKVERRMRGRANGASAGASASDDIAPYVNPRFIWYRSPFNSSRGIVKFARFGQMKFDSKPEAKYRESEGYDGKP
jgi:hypothetical protein